MDQAFERAAKTIGDRVTSFVMAADHLVNTLATQPQDSDAGRAAHKASLEKAYDAYDLARADLVEPRE